MSFITPNLDDRTWDQLVDAAAARLKSNAPSWTPLVPGDPGAVLIDAFAYLTDVLLYRLNRIPEKAYVEFLRLIGVRLAPPGAAAVELRFTLARPSTAPVVIPAGTRVTTGRTGGASDAPVFRTFEDATIAAGASTVTVAAFHCEYIEAESAGAGSGVPYQTVVLARPPVVAAVAGGPEVIVGVEAGPDDQLDRLRSVTHLNTPYRVYAEVQTFADAVPGTYLADRQAGAITFARPVPVGRAILVWYPAGGGAAGNVPAGSLTTLKDSLPGIEVTNDLPAAGGRPEETVAEAMVRGPETFHMHERVVTARDYELVAERDGAIARAKALTKREMWAYAAPGTVEVLLVPYFGTPSTRADGSVTAAALEGQESDATRERIARELDGGRPAGITVSVNWVRYKTVRVSARAVTFRGEDPRAVHDRILQRLHETINPLPAGTRPGWRFGQSLRASNLYDIMLAEKGVSYVDQVKIIVEEVPSASVAGLEADGFQPRTCYAPSGGTLYRTTDDGDGWEPAGKFAGEEVAIVAAHREHPGLLAIANYPPGSDARTFVHVSEDCGETWRAVAAIEFAVRDLAWITRGDVPVLLLATDRGLYELSMAASASPVQVFVRPGDERYGYFAVTAARVGSSNVVAVAAHASGGVWISLQGGTTNTFADFGLSGTDVRVLEVQTIGMRAYLWAGQAFAGTDEGTGMQRRELTGVTDVARDPGQWEAFKAGWSGGSCNAIAFSGTTVFAGTHHSGVLTLDTGAASPAWVKRPFDCGLPVRPDVGAFEAVIAVAVSRPNGVIFAGGPRGIQRSADGGLTYHTSSASEFDENVSLPDTWLFVSGAHEVRVESEAR